LSTLLDVQHAPPRAGRDSLGRGGGVHVGDRDDPLPPGQACEFLQCRRDGGLVSHVGHRAPGQEVRDADRLRGPGEDVGRLGHEVDPAEHDEAGVLEQAGLLGELQAVADEIGQCDDLVGLIVVTEDAQRGTELFLPPPRAVGEGLRRN
jgi:hypothetical protein